MYWANISYPRLRLYIMGGRKAGCAEKERKKYIRHIKVNLGRESNLLNSVIGPT